MANYHIPNLGKACEVLEFVADTPEGSPLKDIAATLNIPRTTALRITQTLLNAGFLDQNDEGFTESLHVLMIRFLGGEQFIGRDFPGWPGEQRVFVLTPQVALAASRFVGEGEVHGAQLFTLICSASMNRGVLRV